MRIKTRRKSLSKCDIRIAVWMMTGGICWYCGKQTHPFGRDIDSFQIDHFVPISQSGTDELTNLVPCCGLCNMRKGGMGAQEVRILLLGGDSPFYYEGIEND